MNISKYLSIVFIATFLCLFFVHQKVELVKVSYQIDKNEKTMSDLVDRNKNLMYNTLSMKAPQRLQAQMVKAKGDFQFAGDKQIVFVSQYKNNRSKSAVAYAQSSR